MDLTAVRISLQVATTSTLLAVALGVPLAWWLARTRVPGRGILSGAVLLPMLLPPTVLGYLLLLLVGRQGPLGQVLIAVFDFTPLFHWSGAALAAFVVSVPFLIRTAQAGFEAVDPVLEEAARTLGRTEQAIFWTVTFPLAWRAIAAGIAMAFARAIGEFGATLMVAGSIPGRTQTLSIAIYEAVQGNRLDDARVLSLLLVLITIGVLALIGIVSGRPELTWRR